VLLACIPRRRAGARPCLCLRLGGVRGWGCSGSEWVQECGVRHVGCGNWGFGVDQLWISGDLGLSGWGEDWEFRDWASGMTRNPQPSTCLGGIGDGLIQQQQQQQQYDTTATLNLFWWYRGCFFR
jgi:hypothetical protein